MINTQQNIPMVDLQSQYKRLKEPIDRAIAKVIEQGAFIKGPVVETFETNLAEYLGVKHVVGVANGTDALQIALMALDLKPGDEVIVPAFTYVATAEVIGLLGLSPVMVDVDLDNFNILPQAVENAITPKSRAIVPVHLFGQSAPMEAIKAIANKYNLYIVEDNAQAIGGQYTTSFGQYFTTGTIGDIGCTSFFPSKNLGCYGDGGALYTDSDALAEKARMIANHGQRKKYIHDRIGVNSRLDAIQAAVLNIKLEHLHDFSERRQSVAKVYDEAFHNLKEVIIPRRESYSSHVFHQYTLRILHGKRDLLQTFLKEKGIPSMVYYPIPLYRQKAFSSYFEGSTLENTELLCDQVLSLPMHTEMKPETQAYIIQNIKAFFNE